MNCGASAESPRASRNRRMAAFQAMLEIDERICRPQPIPERLASDELARLLEQRLEDLDRLVGDSETARPLAELSRTDVELKDTEVYASRR